MKVLKCGLVGCGRIGCGYDEKPDDFLIRTHAMSYVKNNHTKLVSLCDVEKNKLRKFGKIFSVRNHYTDFKEMLEEESLDCLSICTHGDTHLKIVAEAVKNNIKGLMIEKPISDSLHNAEKIIKLCKQKKVILAVNHQRRFNPFYQKISYLLKEGELGKIQRGNLMYGGGIANTGTHIFDTLRLFFGEARSIKSELSKNSSHKNFDPNLEICIEYPGGFIVNLCPLDLKNYGILELDIFGTKKRLSIDLVTNENKIFSSSKISQDYKKLKKLKKSINFSYPPTDIRFGINNIIDCIKREKIPACTGFDGYKSLELVIASMLSKKLKKKILLPVTNKNYKIKFR